jgi:hypothetical protein
MRLLGDRDGARMAVVAAQLRQLVGCPRRRALRLRRRSSARPRGRRRASVRTRSCGRGPGARSVAIHAASIEERRRAAHRIAHGRLAVPVGEQQQAGGGRFVERALVLDLAVAALVQRFAAEFAVEDRFVALQHELDAAGRAVACDVGALAGAFAELVADGVLDDQHREARVVGEAVLDRAVDGERLQVRDALRPVDVPVNS